MSDPVRWLDGADAPAGARDLLASAKAPSALSAAVRARSAASLTARLAATQGAAATTTAATAATWSLGAKVFLATALLGIASAGALVAWRASTSRTQSPAVAAAPTHTASEHRPQRAEPRAVEAAEPPAASAPVPVASEPAPAAIAPAPVAGPIVSLRPGTASAGARTLGRRRSGVGPVVESTRTLAPSHAATQSLPSPAPTPSAETTALAAPAPAPAPPASAPETPEALRRQGETMWLARAPSALARDPESTLRDLRQHESLFPDGRLRGEREAMMVEALHRLGRDDEARARARAFIQRFPSSMYVARIRRLAGTDAP